MSFWPTGSRRLSTKRLGNWVEITLQCSSLHLLGGGEPRGFGAGGVAPWDKVREVSRVVVQTFKHSLGEQADPGGERVSLGWGLSAQGDEYQ